MTPDEIKQVRDSVLRLIRKAGDSAGVPEGASVLAIAARNAAEAGRVLVESSQQ